MLILGLQKTTLVDFPRKVACTIFTGGCNLRCPFCHNSSLVLADKFPSSISEDEIFAFLKKRKGILDGVCITGGEPLIQPDIAKFISKIKDMGYLVKLDTNGCYPNKLKELVNQNLIDYVAMDIKNSPKRYAETVGIKDFDITPILDSVEFLLKGTVPFEFRTTIVKEFHDENSIIDIAKWIKGAPHYYLQDFVDSGDLLQSGLHKIDEISIKNLLDILIHHDIPTSIRGL